MSMFAQKHDNCPTCTCTSPVPADFDILGIPKDKIDMNDLCWFGMGFDDAEELFKDQLKAEHDARIKAENDAMELLASSFDDVPMKQYNKLKDEFEELEEKYDELEDENSRLYNILNDCGIDADELLEINS